MNNLNELRDSLKALASPQQAKILLRFFKTGPGEYGEGDKFLGIKVPQLRQIAKRYSDLSLKNIQKLITSPYHEERFIALVILMMQFKDTDLQETIYDFYFNHVQYINNWDLIDASAPNIVGVYLDDRPRSILKKLSKSDNVWERRIAIVSTFYFIKQNDFSDTLMIAKMLINDQHDLIHKAVGWMLREVGKRDFSIIEEFIQQHHHKMPRTMLRYAIERFPEPLRKSYLNNKK